MVYLFFAVMYDKGFINLLIDKIIRVICRRCFELAGAKSVLYSE